MRSELYRQIYMFDVDGTLTPSRRKMTEEFQKFFKEWSGKNRFYLVTGSDLPKLQEQVPDDILELSAGIFTCCGNQFWREGSTKQWPIDWKLQYENKFKPPQNLLTYLGEELRMSDYHHRAGNHIEDRGSLLNFSVVGRNCSVMERENYFKWDSENGERERISKHIREQWPDIDAVIGGQISIDIYPKGNDKSQIYKHIDSLEDMYCPDEYIFIGDKIESGGNDYPLAKMMDKIKHARYFQTDNPEQTVEILKSL